MRDGLAGAEGFLDRIRKEATMVTRIEVDELKKYLARKGRAPRIKERMMTQYWLEGW